MTCFQFSTAAAEFSFFCGPTLLRIYSGVRGYGFRVLGPLYSDPGAGAGADCCTAVYLVRGTRCMI